MNRKRFIEVKIKLTREEVKTFLLRRGVDADNAMRMAYSDRLNSIQDRNIRLKAAFELMVREG